MSERPEIWTADPNWRRRVGCAVFGLWFAGLVAAGLLAVWLGRHDSVPWSR